MMTNDDTRLLDGREFASQQDNGRKADNEQTVEKDGNKGSWKKVTFGTASGILVGAGAMYAAKALAGNEDEAAKDTAEAQPSEDVKVAKVSDDLSFQDAFDAARAQVGPGGVFRWNGGLYSTYKEDEWDAMSDEDKAEFAQAIRPEVRADEIVAERMSEAQPQVVVIKEQVAAAEPQQASAQTESDIQMAHNTVDNDVAAQNASQQTTNDDDVHVVGRGQIGGYDALALDTNGDGQGDVALIDIDRSGTVTGPDILTDGHYYSSVDGSHQGVIDETPGNDYASDPTIDPNTDPTMQQTAYDNPDLSPDMPDYMDDASLDGTLV